MTTGDKHPRRSPAAAAAALLTAALLAAGCASSSTAGQGSPGASASAAKVTRGGVYRTAVSSFGLTDNLDPTGETQIGFAYSVYDATLRTLVGFRHVNGPAGLQLQPDLATSVPVPTDGGLTYTFHLKPGLTYAPPVNRAVTSYDIAYAFQRINDATLVPQYGYYYDGIIRGLTGTAKNAKAKISGIQTPDANTIIFHLTRPTGDFLQRVAMPAAAPIPPEVGRCFTQPGTYGRDLISSGPYMLAGSDAVDASSCAAIKAMSGFDPTSHITLVRNPNYAQSTDTTRANYINGADITVDPNVADIFAKVQKGQLDGSMIDPPPAVTTQQYLRSPQLRGQFHSDPINQVEDITMNLDVAPFTNVHVRKAVAWVLNKSAMLRALGGTSHYQIATHIMPDTLPGGLPVSYDPYRTPGEAGDLAKAQGEMKLSPYDANHDGKCDAAACKNLAFINISSFAAIDTEVQNDLAKIGIQIVPRDLSVTTAFTALFTIKDLEPMSALGGGYADYTGTFSFAQPNFGSAALSGPVSCCNYSLVGLTRAQAASYKVPYPAGGIPSVDKLINTCEALTAAPRNTCWSNLDKQMMTSVMAWVPYIWGRNIVITAPTVTRYAMDIATSSISLTQIAVSNHAAAGP
ncbi:MAG TPA: ABC transporter substrate-binding protein [Streptosporangiaceae bacterium]|jgi:peptide/nickel transport system substrate-binding protein